MCFRPLNAARAPKNHGHHRKASKRQKDEPIASLAETPGNEQTTPTKTGLELESGPGRTVPKTRAEQEKRLNTIAEKLTEKAAHGTPTRPDSGLSTVTIQMKSKSASLSEEKLRQIKALLGEDFQVSLTVPDESMEQADTALGLSTAGSGESPAQVGANAMPSGKY